MITQEGRMSAATHSDPLHGLTLEAILKALVDFYGWETLGGMISIRCFTHDPSIASSLKFLRRTPWARQRVEQVYLAMQRQRPKPLVLGKKPE
jgi:uncharacterized protein (DUF2132 family)